MDIASTRRELLQSERHHPAGGAHRLRFAHIDVQALKSEGVVREEGIAELGLAVPRFGLGGHHSVVVVPIVLSLAKHVLKQQHHLAGGGPALGQGGLLEERTGPVGDADCNNLSHDLVGILFYKS